MPTKVGIFKHYFRENFRYFRQLLQENFRENENNFCENFRENAKTKIFVSTLPSTNFSRSIRLLRFVRIIEICIKFCFCWFSPSLHCKNLFTLSSEWPKKSRPLRSVYQQIFFFTNFHIFFMQIFACLLSNNDPPYCVPLRLISSDLVVWHDFPIQLTHPTV
jgi:hypothetical protein